MQEVKCPYFKKGRILKIEMLENLRDFPRNILDITNENLTDGVLCGFTPIVDKNIITFSKGITKYNGNLYIMPNPVSLNYGATETDVMIKISFYDEVQDNDYKTIYLDIEIDNTMSVMSNQQEIGRFKLKKGAYLRSNYQDLSDFTTEYNTINIVHTLYAGIGAETMNCKILKYFAKEVLALKAQNPIDISFCFLCLNSERIERDAIIHYLSYKLDRQTKELTNIEIHRELVKILDEIKKEVRSSNKRKFQTNKIMID